MKRVLVTGASGYIGRQTLVPLTARGFDVHATARGAFEATGVAWHTTDLLNAAQRRRLIDEIRPSHLLHLAWDVSAGYWNRPENAEWAAATLALAQEFYSAGGQRFTAAGTCAEYDWANISAPLTEQGSPRRPATVYGQAKETTRTQLAEMSSAAGGSVAWGELFHSYGEWEKPDRLVPIVIKNLLAGQPAPLTSGRQVRDFLDVRDIGAGFAAIVDGPVEGPINLASGIGISVRCLCEKLGALCQRPDLLQLGSLPDRPDDPPNLIANITRLRDDVGFAPANSLEAGLSHAVDWWRASIATAATSQE